MSQLSSIGKLFSLDGKVAVVTGGPRGLGLHTATAFLLSGAKKVILVSRKAEGKQGLNQAVERLNSLPGVRGTAVSFAADLSKTEEIQKLVSYLKRSGEKLDILIANAAATWGGPFEPTPVASTIKVLNLNVQSIFTLIQLVGPLLAKSATATDPSRIIIVGSVAGFIVPYTGDNGTIIYSVSKAAAHHLAKNRAVELGPRNITTNVVAPGFFPSKLANGLIENLGGQDIMNKENPRGRLGEPDDIAGVMVYLCSPAGAYVNGATIPVDGGKHLINGIGMKL